MKKENVKYSFIVPIYNCEKYITKCVNSLVNQTYKNFEILLVDDGSNDNSYNICLELKNRYKEVKIQLYKKENSGVSSTRNYGIDKSKGQYICFIDSDDYLDFNFLENIEKILEKKNYDLINFGFYSETFINGKISYDKIIANEKEYLSKEELKDDLVYLWDKHMLYNIWNKVYKKEIIENNKLKFANQNFGEDMLFNINYLDYTNLFYNSSEAFYHYIKERENSITKKFNENLFEIRRKEYHYFNKYFELNGIAREKYIEFSSRRFIERVAGYIENVCSSNIKSLEKISIIKEVININEVRDSIKKSKLKSKKMKILILPIKYKFTLVCFIQYKLISIIRKLSPSLFNKMKNKR
ncbi:Hyaluronan synthase [Turicibacter sanguinis]|nr:Hyaluronan synthase [Turicibacter sanguinis]